MSENNTNPTVASLMTRYIGVKVIKAVSIRLEDYHTYMSVQPDGPVDPDEQGYLVEYAPDPKTKPNHPDHQGYVSYSPKHVFDGAYRKTEAMNFGLAIEALKLGFRVARIGWNGKNMWLKLVEGRTIPQAADSDFKNESGDLVITSHIDMFSADQKQVVGWLASQTDMLADDWMVVE